jgi:hypothetical protein
MAQPRANEVEDEAQILRSRAVHEKMELGMSLETPHTFYPYLLTRMKTKT